MGILFTFLLSNLVFVSVTGPWTSDCDCGYGGLCLGGLTNGKMIKTSCELCTKISGGFYNSDCQTITDHCLSNPCQRGKCVSTFGSYFCKCPPKYVGHNCQIEAKQFSAKPLYAEVYAYHQVQPNRLGLRKFSIAVNPNILDIVHDVQANSTILVIIDISNGPIYFPNIRHNFVVKNVANECISDQMENFNLQDAKACEYLPAKNFPVFSFDPTLRVTNTVPENRVYIPEFRDAVGIVGNVTVTVMVEYYDRKPLVIYLADYTIFNYLQFRRENNCLYPLRAFGCSLNRSSPTIHLRKSAIKLSMFATDTDCRGALPFRKLWYKQSLSEYKDVPTYLDSLYTVESWEDVSRDDVPVVIPDHGENSRIMFRPMYFPLGLTMLKFEVTLRGDPPHMGGTTVFQKHRQCWINVVPGPLRIQVKGGQNRTASCYQPLRLNFLSLNPSVTVSQLTFLFYCNHTNDEECDKTALEVPVLKKSMTPCNTWYRFEVTAYLALFPEHVWNLTMVIFFKETPRDINVECFFNCDPIDPQEKTIWIAQSEPYVPDPVTWRALWKGHDIASTSSAIDAMFPFKSSRIFALEGNAMSISNDYYGIVYFRASSCGGVFSQASHVVDNLKARLDDFELIEMENNHYKYALKANAKPYPFHPEEYTVHQYRLLTNDTTLLLETKNIDDIRFQAKSSLVYLCIQNGWSSVYCGKTSRVKNVLPVGFYTNKELAVLLNRNLHTFFISLDENLHNGLKIVDGGLRWTHTLKYRYKLLRLASSVDKDSLMSGDIDYVLNIVKKLFYSKKGNAHLGLMPFKDDNFYTAERYSMWMSSRTMNLVLLDTAIDAIQEVSDLQSWSKIRDYLQEFLSTWSLAWDSGFFGCIAQGAFDPFVHDYFHAEMNCQRWHQKLYIYWTMTSFQAVLTKKLPVYYDLEFFGNDHVSVWAIKCSYGCVLQHTKGIMDLTSNDTHHLFFSQKVLANDSDNYYRLQFPPRQPQLASKELTISVSVAKDTFDRSAITSIIYLVVQPTSSPVMITFLNATYIVQMPIEHRDSLAPEFSVSSLAPRDNRNRNNRNRKDHFEAYKVTMPGPYVNFTMEFVSAEAVKYFKVKVTFDRVSSYEETFATRPRKCDKIQTSGQLNYRCSHFVSQQSTEDTFYLAIIIEHPGKFPITISFKSRINVCFVESTHTPWIDTFTCKSFHYSPIKVDVVRCDCTHFGIIYARSRSVNYAKIVTGLQLYNKTPRISIVKFLIIIFVLSWLLLIFFATVRKDKKRNKRGLCLTHLIDNYPNHKYDYKYVVGVFTSFSLFSGTKSMVAIKLEGSKSSSRIHLLRSIPKTTLSTSSENWYVLTTVESLGELVKLYVWHNFRRLSIWKCSQILIYDVENSQWFSAPINKWLDIEPSDDASRLKTVTIIKDDMNKPTKPSLATLMNVVSTEIRNKHVFFSYFTMHPRSLYNFKEAGSLLLLRLTTSIAIVWVLHLFTPFFPFVRGIFPRKSEEIVENLSRLIMVTFVISMISRIITLPFIFCYRSVYSASMFQRKCTNPMGWYTRSSQVLVRKSFRQRMSVMSESARKKSLSQSRTRTSKDRISPDYGSQILRPSKGLMIWNKLKFALFGPCQFLCVNIHYSVVRNRVNDRQSLTRTVSFATAAVLAIAVIISNMQTDWTRSSACYSALSEKECVFRATTVIMVVVILDAFIWEPLIIFMKTICMIKLAKVTNEERILWNQDYFDIPPNNKEIDYATYAKLVTKKEYKPLPRREIRRLRELKWLLLAVKEGALFLVLMSAALIGFYTISQKNARILYFTNSFAYKELTEGYQGNVIRDNVADIDNVIDLATMRQYTSFFVRWTNKWPNGKLMQEGLHWTLDRKSKHLGAVRVIYLVVDNNYEYMTMYRPIKKYFKTAVGYITSGRQNTNNFSFEGVLYGYEKLNNDFIRGRSGLRYPYCGQLFRIRTEKWLDFFTHYRFIMERLRKDMDNNTVRAVIISNNFINVFAQLITATDLLVEFLPSGVYSARLKVKTLPAASNSMTLHCLLFLIALIVPLTFYNAVTASKEGITRYFTTTQHVLRFGILMANILLIVVFTTRYSREASFTHRLIHNVDDGFNIRGTDGLENREILCLLTFLCLVLVEMGLSTKRYFGMKPLSRPFYESTLACCFVLLWCFFFLLMAYVFSWKKFAESPIHWRGPSFRERGSANRPALRLGFKTTTTVILITFLLKFICGQFMLRYLLVEEPQDRETIELFRKRSHTLGRLTHFERRRSAETTSEEIVILESRPEEMTSNRKSSKAKFLFLS